MIDQICSKARKLIAKKMKDKDICLTGDLATVLSSTKGFLVLSGHYIGKIVNACHIFILIYLNSACFF